MSYCFLRRFNARVSLWNSCFDYRQLVWRLIICPKFRTIIEIVLIWSCWTLKLSNFDLSNGTNLNSLFLFISIILHIFVWCNCHVVSCFQNASDFRRRRYWVPTNSIVLWALSSYVWSSSFKKRKPSSLSTNLLSSKLIEHLCWNRCDWFTSSFDL